MASNLPTSLNPAAPVFGSAVGADKKIQARALLADARQLQKEGRLVEARQKAEDARNTGANFGPDEDRPELVMLALSALCQKRIEGLMQQAGDGAAANGDFGRYQRAELDLKQARQLALAFKLDTQLQLIDNKIAWMQQIRDKPPTPAPTTGQAQISQMHHQEPAAASVANPSQHGLELLKQARLELRAGQTSSARRLAETAFSGPYGVQDQAAQILRSIDAEEFNQRVLTANRTYEAAMEAFHGQEYPQAATILRSIDPQLLTADKQARLKEIMLMPGMQPTAVVQAGLRETGGAPQRESAAGQPGRAVASDGAHSAPAAGRPVQPEADFAKQVAALQEVKFQKLRADGLQAQSEATRRFQTGETDRALDILQDHSAKRTGTWIASRIMALPCVIRASTRTS